MANVGSRRDGAQRQGCLHLAPDISPSERIYHDVDRHDAKAHGDLGSRGQRVRINQRYDIVLDEAPRITGVSPWRIIASHLLPNVLGPVLVIATINLALAILTEATLSFLGVGVPPNQPSLGSLIRVGNEYLFSGDWWISILPGIVLVTLSLAVNLVGDWLRDALNPKLSET